MDGVIQLLEAVKEEGKPKERTVEGLTYTNYKVVIGKDKYYGSLLSGLDANDAVTFEFEKQDKYNIITSLIKDGEEYAYNVLKTDEPIRNVPVSNIPSMEKNTTQQSLSIGEKIEILKAAILTHSVPGGELNEEKVTETYNNYLKLF